jgi:hypothetical protein
MINIGYAKKYYVDGHIVPEISFEKKVQGFNKKAKILYPSHSVYFNKKYLKKAKTIIKKNLSLYYYQAWKRYFNNKNKLPSCVTEAMDNLYIYRPKIYMLFSFSTAMPYFIKYNLKGKITGQKTIWNNKIMADYGGDMGGGAAVIEDDKINKTATILIMDAYRSPSKFIKYETNYKKYKFTINVDPFLIETNRYEFLKNEWIKKNEITNSLPGIIFHELVHIALENSSTISLRAGDEATVEDIQFKIFPNAMPIYEANYNEFLWQYIKKNKKHPFKFFSNYKRRAFNPPNIDGLKYERIKYKINIILQGKTMYGNTIIKLLNIDKENTDDCKCDVMKKYLIPYFIYCE